MSSARTEWLAAKVAPDRLLAAGRFIFLSAGHRQRHPDGLRPSLGLVVVLRAELDKVREALFTEPDDQSAWMYQRWVLSEILMRSTEEEDVSGEGGSRGAGTAGNDRENDFYGQFMKRLSAKGRRSAPTFVGEIEGAGVLASSTEAKETPAGGPERGEASFSRESMAEVFAVEMQSCRELIEIEPSCTKAP